MQKVQDVDFFRARTIYARCFEWRAAIRGKVRISEVRLDKPEINVIFHKEGGNNWPKTKPVKTKKERWISII